jgi:hypothetical protein
MPGVLIIALRWLFTTVLGNLVVKLIVGLGIGVVAYTGASALLQQLQNYISSQLGSVPAEVSNILNYCGFYTGLNIIVGAAAARVGTGTAYKFVLSRAQAS